MTNILTIAALILGLVNFHPKVVHKHLPEQGLRDTSENYIVIHYDSSQSVNQAIRYLRKVRNSYHYIINRDGTIYKLIDPKYKANHAGASEWGGLYDLNNYSIGICLHNVPPQSYTQKQYLSAAWLIDVLRKRFNIPESHILGHSDVAEPLGRKQDPGPKFDWLELFKSMKIFMVTDLNGNIHTRGRTYTGN